MYPHTTTQILPIDNINRLARTLVTGDPAVTTIGKESPCPCQTYFESMPTTHFATEELEKEFWSKLHHMMPQRDAEEEMDSRKWQRRQRRAQKSAAKKGRTKGKGSAQKTLTDSSDSDDRRDRETRQQRSGGGTAVESVAERAESDRKRREDEPPVASPQKIRGWILESGKPA